MLDLNKAKKRMVPPPATSHYVMRGGRTKMMYMIDLRKAKKWIAPVVAAALVFAAGCLICRAAFPKGYSSIVERSAAEFGVDEKLIYAAIHTESGFDPTARSSAGAVGLMQLMPETFGWLQTKLPPEGGVLDAGAPEDPEINIRYGTLYLSMLMEKFGDERLAVAAYHAGQNKVQSWIDDGLIAPGTGVSDIPSSATSHYVMKVERAKKMYNFIYS